MTDPRIIAAGATIAIIAALGFFLARPDAPPAPTLGPDGEPWPRAKAMLGTWQLLRDTPYLENDCEGVDVSDYTLVLDKLQVYGLSGTMTMRFTRKAGKAVKGDQACPQSTRGGAYDVSLTKDSFGQLEMGMRAKSCDDNGKSCPLVNLGGNVRVENELLVFGSDRLQKIKK